MNPKRKLELLSHALLVLDKELDLHLEFFLKENPYVLDFGLPHVSCSSSLEKQENEIKIKYMLDKILQLLSNSASLLIEYKKPSLNQNFLKQTEVFNNL